MGTVAKVYAKGLHRQFKYYYTHWLPNAPLEIGTIGELEDGYFFRPVTTLADLGISFSPQNDIVPDPSPSPIDLASSKNVQIITKLSGEVSTALPNIPQGKAGLGLEFSSEGAFVIKAKETYEPRIRNVARLETEILNAHKSGVWKKNYAAIYSIVQAPYADIIVSQSSQSKIELEVQADGQIGKIELGNANVQFSIKKQSGTVLSMLNSRDVTPIFQLVGIKKKLFGNPSAGPLEMVRTFSYKNEVEETDYESLYYVDLLRDEAED